MLNLKFVLSFFAFGLTSCLAGFRHQNHFDQVKEKNTVCVKIHSQISAFYISHVCMESSIVWVAFCLSMFRMDDNTFSILLIGEGG